ncbi:MAG: hypothetical protein ABSH35_13035 [Isosphaeraceae bacterium]|jgi:hypothetical protein
MSDDGRIPDRWDIQLLHDHIASVLELIREPWNEDPARVHLFLSNDLDVIYGIATGKYWVTADGDALEREPCGWPPSVRQALFRLGQVAAELMKPWRWRPGVNEYELRTLILGQAFIDVLESAQLVFSEAIKDIAREDEYEDRDAFIYDQSRMGKSRKQIKRMVNEMAGAKGWRPLRSDQAISQVVRRVSSRTRLKPPSYK